MTRKELARKAGFARVMAGTSVMTGLVLSLGACASSVEPEVDDPSPSVVDGPVEVAIDLGDTVRLDGGAYRVSFIDVKEDSRCPVNVTCVWAGNAVVEIGVAVGSGPTIPVQINTTLDPVSRDSGGLRFTVLDLDPEPRDGQPTVKADYRVRLKVERAG